MKSSELMDRTKDTYILSKPLPMDIQNLPYFKRLSYLPMLYSKEKAILRRYNTASEEEFDNELLVQTPSIMVEHFRCTDPKRMEKAIANSKSKQIEVVITEPVYCVQLRIGKNMEHLLKSNGITLKIKCEGFKDVTLTPENLSTHHYYNILRSK